MKTTRQKSSSMPRLSVGRLSPPKKLEEWNLKPWDAAAELWFNGRSAVIELPLPGQSKGR